MSTITSSRATAPRASGAALRGLATRISARRGNRAGDTDLPGSLLP